MRIRESTPLKIAVVVGTAIAIAMLADVACETTAHADPPGCIVQPWPLPFAVQERGLCDSPIRPDGSWTRHRVVGIPEHYVRPFCSSYGGTFGGGYFWSNGSCSGGYVAPYSESANEFYVVTAQTVLPDEPGHIG